MCHRVLDEYSVPQPRGAGAPSGGESRRRRWLSGAAVTLVGGLALAGWADLQPGTRGEVARKVQPPAAMVPVATSAPAGIGSSTGMTLADDDVPSALGKTGSAAGHCEHGL